MRLRLSPLRCSILALALIAVLGLSFPGAGCARDPSTLSFTEAVRKTTGLRFEGRAPIEVTDGRALELFKEFLLEAQEVPNPSERARTGRPIALRFGDNWEAEPHQSSHNPPSYDQSGYDQSPTARSFYVKWNDKWYMARGEIVSMMEAIENYQPSSYEVDSLDEEFLKPYGWTPFFLISATKVDFPAAFIHKPGDFPEVIYWAWNNELSKDIGLDLTEYLGKTVEIRLYKVVEMLPKKLGTNRDAGRVVIVRSEGNVVGAWLDLGRHRSFACSLEGRTLEEATGKGFDDWVTCLIDPEDPIEQRLSEMSPEEVIETYYSAIDRKDYATAHACESRRYLISYLAMNMDNKRLFNDGFGEEEGKGLADFISVKLLKVVRGERFERAEIGYGDVRCYSVGLDEERRVGAGSLGGCFMTVKQETPATGWRIYSIGTGP